MDAIVAENLRKTYPGKVALEGLNLAIKRHSIHGFLGPNGAGKSTTMNILSCLVRQTEGRAYILGKETLENSLFVKENLGFLPEVPPLYGEMKVGDFLRFQAGLYQMSGAQAMGRAAQVVEKMKLKDVENRLIDHLSKGFKQRVGIAAALICDPPVLILDEPAAGLDPESIREIRGLLLGLREQHTVMLSSHHLGEVEQLCDEMTIIKDGQLVLSDSFDKVQKRFSQKNPLLVTVKGGAREIACALEGLGHYETNARGEEGQQVLSVYADDIDQLRPLICQRLVENGVEVFEMVRASVGLEDIFIDLVGGDE